MKKLKKNIVAKAVPPIDNVMKEPEAFYQVIPSRVSLSLGYTEFKKVAETIPFSIADWSTILHLSERTLQRYAKNNSSFAPIHAERFIQIKKVLLTGEEIFGSATKFYNWLKRNPYSLEGQLSIQSLSTFDGINKLLTQLARIEHGILA